MPDVILQIAVPIFIGHLVLLDFLQWRSARERFVFAAANSVFFTLCLQFLGPDWRGWFENYQIAFVLIASIFVAPAVSVWEAGVLRLFGWKKYSEAFDVTVRINRFLPVALWVVLLSHSVFWQDRTLLMTLAASMVAIIQWVGMLPYSKNGSGGAFFQALTTKIATYIILAGLVEPIFGGYSPAINPLPFLPMFLTAFLAMSLALSLTGWSTLATTTRKALEICTLLSVVLIALELFGYIPCTMIDYAKRRAFAFQFGIPQMPFDYGDNVYSLLALLFAATLAYAFISFSLEKRIVQRARLVPSIVCASIFVLSAQNFFTYHLNGASLFLIAATIVPSVLALILRGKIFAGEKLLRCGNYSGAQVTLESALNLAERVSKYKSELTLRCYVGLAEATARQNLFLQASGFVEKALDTIAGGIRPRDEDAITLQKLATDLHRKTGLAKTNALKERLVKLVPDIPLPVVETPALTTDTAFSTASNGVTAGSTLFGSALGSIPWGDTASDGVSGGAPSQPVWNSGASGGIFGGMFTRRMLARSSDSGIAPGGVFSGVPKESPADTSLQAVPPRIANLVAVAPTWDKSVKARVAAPPPPAELPGFAISSGSTFAVDNNRSYARTEQGAPLIDESWMRPAPEPNEVSLPATASWMQVNTAEQDLIETNKDKARSVSFSLSSEDGSVDGSDSCSPVGPSAPFLKLPSFHKKRDRFDDSGSVFFSWKMWTIKILILVCCPLLLAVSTGLNYLASQNKDLAEACMSGALTIKQVVLGARNVETGHAHQALGEYYLDHGKDELAYLNLRSALSIFDENTPLTEDEDGLTKPLSSDDVTQHNELRRKAAALAEGFGDYDGAVLMWKDIEATLLRAQLQSMRVRANNPLTHTYGNDLFRASTQAARLRGVQQQRDEACKTYAEAFQRRWNIADTFFVPTKYSIDWSREVDSPEFYLEAARASMNYSMVRDSMGNKDKSFIARRMAHLFATRYLQERILEGINQSKEMVANCSTPHDTKIAVSVFADGQLSNLRILSQVGPTCCDHRCLMAIQNGFRLNETERLGVPIPVELVCPIDIEFGFRNRANIFGYGAPQKDDGLKAYIP